MANRRPYYAALQLELLDVYGRAMKIGAAKKLIAETYVAIRIIRALHKDVVYAPTFRRHFWHDIEAVRKYIKSRLNGRHVRLTKEQRKLERALIALRDECRADH